MAGLRSRARRMYAWRGRRPAHATHDARARETRAAMQIRLYTRGEGGVDLRDGASKTRRDTPAEFTERRLCAEKGHSEARRSSEWPPRLVGGQRGGGACVRACVRASVRPCERAYVRCGRGHGVQTKCKAYVDHRA